MPRVSQGTRVNQSHKLQRTVDEEFEVGFLHGLDRRCKFAKILQENYDEIAGDVGPQVSHVQSALIERFVWLEAIISNLESQMATGTPEDRDKKINKWVQAVNSLIGLGKTIGIQRNADAQPWSDLVLRPEKEEQNG